MVAAVFFVVALCTASLLHAQTAEEINAKIDDHAAKIEALDKEIAQYEKQLTQVASEKRTLESAVKELAISEKKTRASIAAEQQRIARSEDTLADLSTDIAGKQSSIELNRDAIVSTIRAIRLTDDITPLEYLLGQGTLEGYFAGAEAEAQFQDSLSEATKRLSLQKVSLESTKDATEAERKRLLTHQKNLKAQEQALRINKSAKTELLSDTKEKESNYQKTLNAKRAAKEAFESAMNELQSQLAYVSDPSKIPPAGKGVLRWPLDAVTITQRFGNTDFAKSGAYNGKGHNGVDFRASIGTPVKASLAGTVVATGNTDAVKGCYSYGKWVLIRHMNGLSTLYAHLSVFGTAEGAQVDTGEVIGYSGNTGYSTGPHLHFTVFASDAVQVRKLGELKTKTNCAAASIPVSAFEGYLNPLEYL